MKENVQFSFQDINMAMRIGRFFRRRNYTCSLILLAFFASVFVLQRGSLLTTIQQKNYDEISEVLFISERNNNNSDFQNSEIHKVADIMQRKLFETQKQVKNIIEINSTTKLEGHKIIKQKETSLEKNTNSNDIETSKTLAKSLMSSQIVKEKVVETTAKVESKSDGDSINSYSNHNSERQKEDVNAINFKGPTSSNELESDFRKVKEDVSKNSNQEVNSETKATANAINFKSPKSSNELEPDFRKVKEDVSKNSIQEVNNETKATKNAVSRSSEDSNRGDINSSADETRKSLENTVKDEEIDKSRYQLKLHQTPNSLERVKTQENSKDESPPKETEDKQINSPTQTGDKQNNSPAQQQIKVNGLPFKIAVNNKHPNNRNMLKIQKVKTKKKKVVHHKIDYMKSLRNPSLYQEKVNYFRFNYSIGLEDFCEQHPKLFMLLIVHTSPDNKDRRMVIRSRWGNRNLYKSLGIRTLFFVGRKMNKTVDDALRAESEKYGDIVIADFVDSYRNLTYKAMSWFQWVDSYCHQISYVLKADDDAFINIFKVLLFLRHPNPKKPFATIDGISCQKRVKVPVIRSKKSKWFVSKEDYSDDIYPPHCPGVAIIVGRKLIPRLLEASYHVPFFWVDDVYFSGLLTYRLSVPIRDISTYFEQWHNKKLIREERKLFAFSHVKNSSLMHSYWKDIIKKYIVKSSAKKT